VLEARLGGAAPAVPVVPLPPRRETPIVQTPAPDTAAQAEQMLAALGLESPEEVALPAVRALLESRRYAEALTGLELAEMLMPPQAELPYLRALALDGLGRKAEAAAACDEALGMDPRHVGALKRKGSVSLELDRFAQALEAFDRALAVEPRSAYVVFHRAVVLDKLGRADDARQGFHEFLRIAGEGEPASRVQHARSRVASVEGAPAQRVAGAVAGRPAAAAAPDVPLPDAAVPNVKPTASTADCLKRGEINLNQGQCDKALSWLDQAIAGEPGNARGWELKGDALYRLTRHAEAVAQYRKALALLPRAAGLWAKLGAAFEALARYTDALAAWDSGVEAAPDNPMLWNGRGLALYYLERYDDAMKSYEKALALDARFAFARFNKAHLEEKLGRRDDALRSFQQFLSLAPPQLGPQIQEARRRLSELRAP